MSPEFEKLYQEKGLNLLNEEEVNYIIKQNGLDTNKISDGYHTFQQLYDHRIELYIALCAWVMNNTVVTPVWRSQVHSDGTKWPGWFLLGINDMAGKQLTYHLPMAKWDACNFAETLDKAPKFDGHTGEDVLERLSKLRQ